MSLLLRLNADGLASIDGAPAPRPQSVLPAAAGPSVAGRGDGRLATYKRKPSEAKEGPDWAALGYRTMPDFLADPSDGAVLLLEPADDPQHLADKLGSVARIAIHFPKFTDGRGYSIAAILRQRLGWRGELRAVGDVLRDQLFYMARCGFDAFELRGDQDPDEALAALTDFSDVYQGAADGRPPLFRRLPSS